MVSVVYMHTGTTCRGAVVACACIYVCICTLCPGQGEFFGLIVEFLCLLSSTLWCPETGETRSVGTGVDGIGVLVHICWACS